MTTMKLISKMQSSKGDLEDSSGDSASSNEGHKAAKETRMTNRDRVKPKDWSNALSYSNREDRGQGVDIRVLERAESTCAPAPRTISTLESGGTADSPAAC
jgi:hypothetical protein